MDQAISNKMHRFEPLPGWGGVDGAERTAGFELEFTGLEPAEAAAVAQDEAGGEVETADDGDLVLRGSGLGELKIYLDTALRHKAGSALAEAGLDLGRAVIPVEIVTPPLEPELWPALDALRDRLRQAGATGTGGGLLLGFGLHLNPTLADPEGGGDLPAVGAAYALLEDWLRRVGHIDISRRILPFTKRYPGGWLDWLAAEGAEAGPRDFAAAYLEWNPSRNHGLDLLPAIRALWPDLFRAKAPEGKSVSGRPAYHVRAPDCRIDEPDWSIALEWNRWVLVERVAREAAVMAELRAAWRAQPGPMRRVGSDWTDRVAGILVRHGLARETGQ